MRNFLLFTALMFVCIGNLKAQHIINILDSTFVGADTSFFYEESFVELDTSSYLTTSYLWDRTPFNLALNQYDGSTEAEGRVTDDNFIQGYLDIRGSSINSNTLPDYDSIVNLNAVLSIGYDALPINIIDYTVSRILSGAFNLGLLSFSNGVLSTTGNGSPFEEMEVFMAGMLNQTFPLNDTFSIIAPYIGYNGTNGATVDAIRINLNDGSGWQNLTWNVSKEFYLSGEEGEFDFEIEVAYSDQSTKVSKNRGIKKSSGCTVIPAEEAPWGGEMVTYTVPAITGNPHGVSNTLSFTRYVNYHMTSSQQFGGRNGKGNVYVRYRAGAPAPRTFKKPVIIVEGIDFGKGHSETRNGSFGWPEMFGCNSDIYPNAKMPDFVDALYANDNDLILLDFFDGADYIQRNAMLLKELINRINQNMEGDEEIIIVAVSMGGQVARYTLSDMESNNEDHCVRLFASHDSPWKGANISPSIQFFAKYMGELQNKEDAKAILNMLNRPAAKQLLLFHYKNDGTSQNNTTINKVRQYHWGYNGDASDPLRQMFINDLNAVGDYPKKCRSIAVANGNSSGVRKHVEGSTQFSLNSDCLGFDLRFNFYDLNRSDKLVSDINVKGNYRRRWYLYGLPAINGVPGGYRSDLKDVEEGLRTELANTTGCGNVTVPSPLQNFYCFVPTISALNIANAGWDAKVTDFASEKNPLGLGNTHFEAYFAPVNIDEDHGQVTDANIAWLMEQITYGEKKLEVNTGGVLAKSWNNPTENSFISSIDINAGGTLYLNANANLYDYTASGSPKPVEGSTSHVRIGSSCSTTEIINVNTGGKLILGDIGPTAPTNNKAYLYITNGAEVHINSGGEVKINNGSKFIVENGGKLIINSSGTINSLDGGEIIIENGGELIYASVASIDLNGYGSVLNLKGKLSVGANATFKVSGLGKVIFDQALNYDANGAAIKSEFWDIGANAKFEFVGPSGANYNPNHNLIEAYSPILLDDGTTSFAEVRLENGRIALHDGALLFSYAPTTIKKLKVEAAYPWQKHGGIRIWNTTAQSHVSQSEFRDGNIGLLVHNLAGSAPFTVTQTHFEDCGKALWVVDGPFSVINSTFDNNNWAIKGDDLTGQSGVQDVDVSCVSCSYGKGVGIAGSSQTGASINITRCDFSHLYSGIAMEGMNVKSTCSDYSFITGGEGAISLYSSILDIADNAENKFFSNNQDIYLGGSDGQNALLMNNGFNDFEPKGRYHGLYISGYIDPSAPFFSDPIVADNNRLLTYTSLSSGQVMPIDLFNLTTNAQITFQRNPFLTSITRSCGTSSGSGTGHSTVYNAVLDYTGTGGSINSSYYTNSSFKTAALDAIDDVSIDENDIRDDGTAVVKMADILLAVVSNADATTDKIKTVLYMQMTQALNNAYGYGAMLNSENMENGINDTVEDVISVLDDYLEEFDINDTTTYDLKFRYTLDKSHIYRVGGYHDEALALLNSPTSWTFNNTQVQRAGYWQCACQVEKDYFDGALPEEEYINQKELCKQQYIGYTYKSASANGSSGYIVEQTDPVIMEVYPQPTHDKLTLVIEPAYSGLVMYNISDLTGRVLNTSSCNWNGTEMSFDVHQLKAGAYFINLQFEDGTRVVKFLKK